MVQTVGTRMTWEEMVEKYPDMWVSIRDAEMDGPDVVAGMLDSAISDEEIGDYEADHWGDGLICRRTTEGGWLGPISAGFTIKKSHPSITSSSHSRIASTALAGSI